MLVDLVVFDIAGTTVYDEDAAHRCLADSIAEMAGAPQALIVAALLHDVGHLLNGRAGQPHSGGDAFHEIAGQRWLGRFFGPDVTEPVRHVDAKRSLCTTDPAYLEALSPASGESLSCQGGPLHGEEPSDFAHRPFALAGVRLRRWDDRAKATGRAVPALEHYRDLLMAVARHAVSS